MGEYAMAREIEGKGARTVPLGRILIGILIAVGIAAGVVLFSFLLLPLLFVFIVAFPLWIWYRYRRHTGAKPRDGSTIVGKESYRVVDDDESTE
jgi:membrane protein implicated in regulation of membrane protease activity